MSCCYDIYTEDCVKRGDTYEGEEYTIEVENIDFATATVEAIFYYRDRTEAIEVTPNYVDRVDGRMIFQISLTEAETEDLTGWITSYLKIKAPNYVKTPIKLKIKIK